VLLLYLGSDTLQLKLWWPLAILDWMLPYTVVITVFFILAAIRLKRYWIVGLLGATILASAWNIQDIWANGSINSNAQGKTLTIMTHNAGNGLANPLDLVSVLKNSQADLIGLQEITTKQASAIEKSLEDLYPYQILFGAGIPGKGLLSKFPILEYRQLHLYPDRPDLLAVIQVHDSELTVIVAHPPPPRVHSNGIYMNTRTQRQLDALLHLATQHNNPVLLMGDFNMTALSDLHARIRSQGLVDAFQVSGQGLGLTLPMRWKKIPLLPMARVDYIWHSTHFTSLESWIGDHTGSDHLPVLAKIKWMRPLDSILQ
jgi:vancomycin resistance protein VanJ